ncbi:MAG TPA: N-acetyl-gamma-glutamyl-phosphate reductase [Phycisphaerae bacterium]|nr:N-acetyl-gamma-glutamyl-phosphate reductase [Phycisphaerae bacterium]
MKKIRVAIVGASGYTSLETIRWLLRHPAASITYLASRKPERPISELFPELLGRLDLPITPFDAKAIAKEADVALLCLPHAAALEHAPSLLQAGLKVVDFSADYRIKDPKMYEKWYQHTHNDLNNLAQAVYGLPEFFEQAIKSATLVSNPGCYPTAAVLGTAPLVKAGLAEPADIIINAASGISGAGRTPSQQHHFPERNEAFEAYAIGTHRHAPEIEQTLTAITGKDVQLLFVPHLIPMDRGILETIYLKPAKGADIKAAEEAFANAYGGKPFIRLRTSDLPSTKYVANTNYADIAVRFYSTRFVVTVAIDNMVKGAAGQAIQNMNIMFGLDQTLGLI